MKEKTNEKRIAYTGIPLKKGEVLVPILVDDNFIRTYQLSNEKIRSWSTAGVPYKVAFNAVPAEYQDMAMQQYYSALNDLLDTTLGRNRDSRCLVPQPDGSLKVCPKKRGDNRVACRDCPVKGDYEKEDKAIISLDELEDTYELFPAAIDDTEEETLLPLILESLMRRLQEEDERSYDALVMLYEGGGRKETVKKLGEKYDLKSTQAYEICRKAIKMLKEEIKL